MAYETFIDTVEAANLLKEIEKRYVFAIDCNREYEGLVKQKGDSVRILVAGKPTIYELEKDSKGGTRAANADSGTGKDVIQKNIGEAEEIENATVTLQINQVRYFHYFVGDIDAAQASKKNIIPMYRKATARALAAATDKSIALKMASSKDIVAKTPVKLVAGEPKAGETNVLDFFDDLVLELQNNEVEDSTQLVAEVSPKVWKILKKAYRELDTNNSKFLAGRKLGMYNDIIIKRTTSCYNVINKKEFVFIRTRDAIAFVQPLTVTKAYEPDGAFSEAIKGFTLYDAEVLRPKEAIATEIQW